MSKKQTSKKPKKNSPSTTSSRKVSHKGARAKGHSFERQIANELGHIFPEAKRQLEYQSSDCVGTDIAGTDRLKIQCKFRQNYVPVGTIREVLLRNEKDIPILITKGNNQDVMAVLPWKDLLKLVEIAYGIELPFRTFDYSDALAIPYQQKPKAIEVEVVSSYGQLDDLI